MDAIPQHINNRGEVIGQGLCNAFEFGGWTFANKGFIFCEGTYTELLPPGCTHDSFVNDINDSGVVVGSGRNIFNQIQPFIAVPK